MTPTPPYTSERYFLDEYVHSLFPLRTTEILVSSFPNELKDFINRLLDPSAAEHFLPQQRCYAAKKGFHLRRTVKLDPVAEFFLHDIVFRNRSTFRKDHQASRRSFGYRFSSGKPSQASADYGEFQSAIREANALFEHTISIDIATYFNAIYHHDLVNHVRGINWPEPDAEVLGRFLRETNSGRSVDCLPQGIHPCKVLGAEFLRFLDNSYMLQSNLMLRFMDDIHLFSDEPDALTADILTIQKLLGEKGLSLNYAKTMIDDSGNSLADELDSMKRSLLQLRRTILIIGYDEDDQEELIEHGFSDLNDEQTEYLLNLIKSPDIEESDAELVLTLLRDHGEEVLPRMVELLKRFPGLTKSIYNFQRFAPTAPGLDELILDFLSDSPLATEFQLFWLGKTAEDFLSASPHYGSILNLILDHPNGTVISRAKILEVGDRRFGLPEHREQRLRSGRSDWEAWSSAMGMRVETKAARNHVLKYFANSSPLNRLIADCVQRI